MAQLISGLFSDSSNAGQAVAELKNLGFTKDISVIQKDVQNEEVKAHDIKKDVSDGAGAGAATGAAMGAVAAGVATLLVGAVSFLIPGAGLIVLGPLAAALTGAAAGAVTGGVVGALVDLGFPEEKARIYERQLLAGDTLVSVSVSEDKVAEVQSMFDEHQAQEVAVLDDRK